MSDHKTAAAPTLTGYLTATINGDDNYYTRLEVAWVEPKLRVTVSSKRPIGGMDGPGGSTDMEVTAEETFLIRSPKDLPKALVGIKALIKGDEVLSKYAKVKELEWYKGASNFGKVLARGLSSEVLQGVLFGAAEGEGTLRSAAIRLAASNPGPVRDALLPVLAKTAAKDNDDLWEQVGELDEAMAEVRKSLGRFNRAAKAKGLTGLVKAVKAFVDADTAFFNALDALLDESKTAAGAPKVVDPPEEAQGAGRSAQVPFRQHGGRL